MWYRALKDVLMKKLAIIKSEMNCPRCIHCHKEQRVKNRVVTKKRGWWDYFGHWDIVKKHYCQFVCTLNPEHVDVDSQHFCSHFAEDSTPES